MDANTYTVALIKSVIDLLVGWAWPAAVVIVAIMFRSEIRSALSRPLRRMKAWGVEAEWEERAGETATEVVRASAPAQAAAMIAPQVSLLERLADIAEREPTAAILAAYAELEKVIRQRLAEAGIPDADKTPFSRVIAAAMTRGIVTAPTVEAIQGVTVLRNLAAHRPDAADHPERATDYLAMVDSVMYAFESNVKRALAAKGRAASRPPT